MEISDHSLAQTLNDMYALNVTEGYAGVSFVILSVLLLGLLKTKSKPFIVADGKLVQTTRQKEQVVRT